MRFFQGLVHDKTQVMEFPAHINVPGFDLASIGAEDHSLNQHMRIFKQEFPVFTGPRFRLIGVATEVTGKYILSEETPF